MKILKYVLYGVGGLIGLAVIAVVAAVFVVDGAFVKARMEQAMKEKNRTLKIEGTPTVSLFPVLRLGLGKTRLSEAGSDKTFAALDSLEVAVRVMPLLSREVAVDALALSGLRLNVVRSKDGSFNFADLAGPGSAPTAAPSEPPKLRIAEVKIEQAHIAYTDQGNGQTLAISNLNVKTGRLEDDTPTPLTVSAAISGKQPEVALKTELSASARMNLARQSFAFSKLDAKVAGNAGTLRGLDLRLTGDVAADVRRQEYLVDALALRMKGTLDRDALAATLNAPRLRITSSKAEGQAITGNFSVKGPRRNVEAKLNVAAVEGSAATLSVPSFALVVDGQIGGNALKGQVTTPIKANLKEGVWELAKVAARFSLGRPDTALKAQLAGAATVNPARQMVSVTGLDATAAGSYDRIKGLDLRFTGNVAADARKQEYTADKVVLRAKGTLDRDVFSASLLAPKLLVTPSKAEGQAVTGAVTVKGPRRDLDAKFNIAAVEGSAKALSIPNVSLEIDAAMEHLKMKANLRAALKANLEKQDLDADISGKLDDSAVKAKVALTNFAPLAASFDATLDRLNVDRYLPPEKKDARPDEPIDLAGLKGMKVNGKLAVGQLTVKRVKLENLKAEIKLADGKLEVAPWSANLYGGTTSGSLAADANGNRFHIKESAQNVAIGALLRDAAQKDLLEGRGNVTLDVQTAGATVPALKKALAGTARVQMKDGAIKGVNLADSARNIKSAIGGRQTKPDPSQKTDFSEMSASFNIKGGVARNDDLKAQSPFLRLGGAGNLDIGNNAIDYLAKATLAATSKGQGGREAGQVAGVTIPVKLSGALDNPSWNIDYSALLGSAGGVLGKTGGGAIGRAAGAITGTAKKGTSGVTDAVRGLFKR